MTQCRACGGIGGGYDVRYDYDPMWTCERCGGDGVEPASDKNPFRHQTKESMAEHHEQLCREHEATIRSNQKTIEGLMKEVERLRLYERAMQSMATQFIHPKKTAEELARQQLKGREEQ